MQHIEILSAGLGLLGAFLLATAFGGRSPA